MNPLAQLFQRLPPPLGGRLLVAFSGGLDSTVLLHALVAAGVAEVRAAHVHHGLQPQAESWAAHCTAFCADLGVPCAPLRVHIDARDPAGPEGAARRQRYAALRGLLAPGEVLVTAHHRDDQAETVLLRLLRGAGPDGLAGIGSVSEFAPGWLWRPLLDCSREELRVYAESHRLRWIEDPHNGDLRYTRVWLRRRIMPLLAERFPCVDAALARGARHCGDQQHALQLLLAERLQTVIDEHAVLNLQAFAAQPLALRPWLLRAWFKLHGQPAPNAATLARIQAEMIGARADAQPRLRVGGYELRRYRQRLFAMPVLPSPPEDWSASWSEDARCRLADGFGELAAADAPPQPLTVRFAVSGVRLRVGGHGRSLKTVFQQHGVPPWLRSRVPLLCRQQEVLDVAGWILGDEISQWARQNRWRYRWLAPPWARRALLDAGLG
ncbi:MAG: tRNA lysidine(34) synthetase TilS [Gammaproteobacteria bacterium]|nr:tRNA lysidine(34) synthetase TilS [Gammaproteobacteria bacterium]